MVKILQPPCVQGDMEVAAQLKRGISRQFSTGSLRMSGKFSFKRQNSFDPRRNNTLRFSFGRQSSLDPIRRGSPSNDELSVPENLDCTMQLLFMACRYGRRQLVGEGSGKCHGATPCLNKIAMHNKSCQSHCLTCYNIKKTKKIAMLLRRFGVILAQNLKSIPLN